MERVSRLTRVRPFLASVVTWGSAIATAVFARDTILGQVGLWLLVFCGVVSVVFLLNPEDRCLDLVLEPAPRYSSAAAGGASAIRVRNSSDIVIAANAAYGFDRLADVDNSQRVTIVGNRVLRWLRPPSI
jgi:hypothetical protein